MSKSWPPPPDLDSVQELVAAADVEGFIADGSPQDEYETEAEAIFERIQAWPQADLTAERLLPVLEEIWASAFSPGVPALEDRRVALEDRRVALEDRRVKLRELAAQIERFFGPQARPQVRGS